MAKSGEEEKSPWHIKWVDFYIYALGTFSHTQLDRLKFYFVFLFSFLVDVGPIGILTWHHGVFVLRLQAKVASELYAR